MKFSDDKASGPPSGEGAPPLIVEPDKYSYTFGVPQGWEFSVEQAHQRGASLAFFPKGGNFNNSDTVIYVNEIDEGCAPHCISVLAQRINNTIQDVRDENPAAQVTPDPPAKTKEGVDAQIRLVKGARDPRDPKAGDDSEILAFIGHDETIILIVLTARNTKTWDRDYGAFKQLIAGHKFFNCKSPELRVPCAH